MSRNLVNKTIEYIIAKNPEASLVKNKYRVITSTLLKAYPLGSFMRIMFWLYYLVYKI